MIQQNFCAGYIFPFFHLKLVLLGKKISNTYFETSSEPKPWV